MTSDADIRSVLEHARGVVRSLAQAEERLHDDEGMTAGMRGVLFLLDRRGPQTVPQIAREHDVSRQYIQPIVNRLSAVGQVEMITNAAHERSKRIRLTSDGQAVVRWMQRRQNRLLGSVAAAMTGSDVRRAGELLARIQAALEDYGV